MSAKVLVVGATGLVGREVVRELVDAGEAVKAGSRAATPLPGAEPTVLDLGDPTGWPDALEGVDRVFLLIPSVATTWAERSVPPALAAMEDAGVERIVCMTGLTSDRPGSTLRPVEDAVMASAMQHTILRPNWFDQNFAPGYYLPMINGMGGLFVPAGDAPVSFVDVRDIGAVAATTLTEAGHAGAEYALTGPEALDHHQACALLSEASGRSIGYTPISDDDLRGALTAQGMPEEGVEEMVHLYRIVREGSCAPVTHDVERVLGRPAISFRRYAEDHAELFRTETPAGAGA